MTSTSSDTLDMAEYMNYDPLQEQSIQEMLIETANFSFCMNDGN